jgi:quinolinate synthase
VEVFLNSTQTKASMVASIAYDMNSMGNRLLDYTHLNVLIRHRTVTMSEIDYKHRVLSLKKERNAVILAHNYQLPEVQAVADVIGDSLALSQCAAKSDANIIIFCGVHFMAETAAIICPDKQVLIPDLDAGCSLASTINARELKSWLTEHPDAVVVSYINTTADVKALSDYCCTSSNAIKVVNSIPSNREVLFLPDMFLGSYVAEMTKRKNMFVWPGECHVHAGINAQDINEVFKNFNNADFLVHPECGCTSTTLYHISTGELRKSAHILSTEGMMKHACTSAAKQFVVATETGILYRMEKENPHKQFIPIKKDAICRYMKLINLEKIQNSLLNNVYQVKVPPETAVKARAAIERMLAIS